MRLDPIPACLLVLLALGASPAQATVSVEYGNPDRFTDAGDRNGDSVKVMKVLADYLKQLGQRYLPPGTDVHIDVLDLDRAGHTRMNLPTGIRIMSGRADPPCIEVRYTVALQGRTSEPRKEHVCDLNYLRSLGPGDNEMDPLVYEKRMLRDWFRERFAAAPADARGR